MAIIRVSGTCDSGSTPDRTTFLFFCQTAKTCRIHGILAHIKLKQII